MAMQQATAHNMPLAIANAGSWAEWRYIVANHRVLTFWYTPDGLFADLDLIPVEMPEYSPAEYAVGLKTTAPEVTKLYNFAATGLRSAAPDAVALAERMTIDSGNIMDMLKSTSTESYYNISCQWLRENEAVWASWIPSKTDCVEGQGLIDLEGNFLPSPLGASGCDFCSPGSSSQLWNGTAQRVCGLCSPGAFQNQPGESECKPCESGKYTPYHGTVSCESCPAGTFAEGYGTFADSSGSSECTACPAEHETTDGRGASSRWECICEEGFYRQSGHSEAAGTLAQCAPCPDGMVCDAGNSAPTLLAGNWADEEDLADRRFSIYRCRDAWECPGGAAGTCAAGRDGIGCAFCKPDHQKSDMGSCEPCEGSSVLPILFAVLIALAVISAIALYANKDVTKIKSNTVAMGICVGQAVVFVQSFQLFSILKVRWAEPYISLMKVMSYITLDLNILGLSCFLDDSSAVSRYAMTLLMFPIGVLMLGVAFVIMNKFTTRAVSLGQAVNSVGLLTLMLFLVLNMQGIAPFHCISSPNGTSSLESNPAITCYEGEWPVLAVLGVLALLTYGVSFMAWCVWVTVRYPGMATSPQGTVLLSRYAFMFQRFTVDCYYFTPIYLLRALAMNILVVVFANYGHRQVLSLSVMFVLFGSVMGWLKPLRGVLTNALEVIIACCLVLSLVCAALFLQVDEDVVASDLQIFFTIVVLIVFGAIIGIAGLLFWRSVQPGMVYAAFLCHHKVGCGVGARLMKLELEHLLRSPVFLDSDNLEDLDTLLDTVRCVVRNLVVLLTDQTLSRPWCAGEIGTAFRNAVRMIPVAFDNYEGTPEDDLTVESIGARWSADQFAPCQRNGVSLEIVRQAYVYLEGLSKVPCHRVASCMRGEEHATIKAIGRVAALCRDRPAHADGRDEDKDTEYARSSLPIRRSSTVANLKGSAVETEVAILANQMDAEAISSAAVIAYLIRQQTQWQVVEFFSPTDVQKATDLQLRPKSILVLLTEGSLTSEGFSRTLLASLDAWAGAAKMLPVGSEMFTFPSSQALNEIVVPKVSDMLGRDSEEVAAAMSSLFAMIAARFSGTAGIATLRTEVATMLSRLHRQALARRLSTDFAQPFRPTGNAATPGDNAAGVDAEKVGAPPSDVAPGDGADSAQAAFSRPATPRDDAPPSDVAAGDDASPSRECRSV